MIHPADLLEIAREALVLSVILSLPVIGAAFIAGLVSACLQALTRVSEPALTNVPRIAAVALAVWIAAPWMGGRVAGFAERVWILVQTVHL